MLHVSCCTFVLLLENRCDCDLVILVRSPHVMHVRFQHFRVLLHAVMRYAFWQPIGRWLAGKAMLTRVSWEPPPKKTEKARAGQASWESTVHHMIILALEQLIYEGVSRMGFSLLARDSCLSSYSPVLLQQPHSRS